MCRFFYTFLFAILSASVYADDFECTPGTHYKENECNTCFCTSGGMLICGMRRCVYEWRHSLYNCHPGEKYHDECNTCWCVEGFGTICTHRKCP